MKPFYLILVTVLAVATVFFVMAAFRARSFATTPAAVAITQNEDGIPHRSEFTVLPDDALRKRLTPRQFKVAREDGTEPAFANRYWNNKEAGLYVDVVSGEPLFSSIEKFQSGTGWPSFWKPLETGEIVEHTDTSWGMRRVEVRSKTGDTHLGHVFSDGPAPTGLRYCINSAALVFIPKEKLEEKGYGEFARHFSQP